MMMTRKKRKINLCFVTLVKVLTFDVGYESNTICCCLALQYLKRAGSLSWYGLDMLSTYHSVLYVRAQHFM